MLSQEENEILTRVGPGTLMGNLLRRYWTPACLSSELPKPDDPPIRVRLLGENLVAFRDTNGKVGLMAENCPHRGASVFFGRNEECGLRCVYHGWKFDVDGNCVDMPNEPAESSFKHKVKATSYPTHESGGLVWAYMGPRETMTPFRDFGSDSIPEDLWQAGKLHSTCNWVQSMEGNLDSSHISYLHQYFAIKNIPDDGTDRPGYPTNLMSMKFWAHDRAPRFELVDEWYGYRYAAVRTTPNGHKHIRVNAYVVPWGTCVASIPFGGGQGLFVPIDDENCWRYNISMQQVTNPSGVGGPGYQADPNWPYGTFGGGGRRPGGMRPRGYTSDNDYNIDRAAQKNVSFSGVGDFVSQDLMVTESMGRIYDRSTEHLGTTDVPVIRMRRIMIDAARALAEGKEPPALAGVAGHDFRSIRSVEKILEPGEDWNSLGTAEDPMVQAALFVGDARR
ncbi:MAG: Rieske 2Fe-2S domain-containing protein [Chloroflexota bacterium]